MKVYYFTFGSDPAYPYERNEYVMVLGKDRADCIEAYRKKHPNRPGSEAFNAADCYPAEEWEKLKTRYYPGKEPAEILVSEKVYGQKPEGFEPIWFMVPEGGDLIFLQEGDGSGLSKDDIESGMQDYLDCTIYNLAYGEIDEKDGGQIMFPYLIREKYGCLADTIPAVMDFFYDNLTEEVQILRIN